nr:hypothetical protein [Pandoravirus belohorizontensis]
MYLSGSFRLFVACATQSPRLTRALFSGASARLFHTSIACDWLFFSVCLRPVLLYLGRPKDHLRGRRHVRLAGRMQIRGALRAVCRFSLFFFLSPSDAVAGGSGSGDSTMTARWGSTCVLPTEPATRKGQKERPAAQRRPTKKEKRNR